MVVDWVAPFLMDESSGTDLMMDCVIIWCDAIKLDGGVINKVGSYSVWLSALYANVPVYIAGNLLKVDIHDKIQIERRESHEVWEDSPEWLNFLNFAFDKIPPKFIRGIITEFGIILVGKGEYSQRKMFLFSSYFGNEYPILWTEKVNFDGFCKKCYEENINTKIDESKLKKENIKGESNANKIHYKVGETVRKTIEEHYPWMDIKK